MSVFEVDSLVYRYADAERPALDGVSVAIAEGEFVLLLGGSGSGKTSFCRLLGGFLPRFYGGVARGKAAFYGQDLFSISERKLRGQLGMVFQDPETQLVMTEVERDIVFGLENLGLPPQVMRRRLQEVLQFFSLQHLRKRRSDHLSGGERQKVVLAGILAMSPTVLLLDEPTSQLSPAAARETLALLRDLHESFGYTIILVEQRLEEAFAMAERVLQFDGGKIAFDGSPQAYVREAIEKSPEQLPPAVRLIARRRPLGGGLTVRELRGALRRELENRCDEASHGAPQPQTKTAASERTAMLRASGVSFSYAAGRAGPPAVRNLDLQVFSGECLVVVGDNGAGKSTLLRLLAGAERPDAGAIARPEGPVAYLGQDPNLYLLHSTVEEELLYTLKNFGLEGVEERIAAALAQLHLSSLRKAHPFDLSSGERQRVALASVLVSGARLLVLDEPTRGADGAAKNSLAKVITDHCAKPDSAAVVATQDMEFAALIADRVVVLADGEKIDDGEPGAVLHGNLFLTTQINRLFRGICDGVVSEAQAEKVLRGGND